MYKQNAFAATKKRRGRKGKILMLHNTLYVLARNTTQLGQLSSYITTGESKSNQ